MVSHIAFFVLGMHFICGDYTLAVHIFGFAITLISYFGMSSAWNNRDE